MIMISNSAWRSNTFAHAGVPCRQFSRSMQFERDADSATRVL